MAPHQDEAGPARTNAVRHPLDPLSGEEIRQAAGILRRDGRAGAALRFVSVSLHEPPKSAVAPVRRVLPAGAASPPLSALPSLRHRPAAASDRAGRGIWAK